MRVTYLLSNTAGIGLIAVQEIGDRLEIAILEHAGLLRGGVGVIGNRIPRAEHDVVERRERNEILDQRRAILGALAKPNRRHLRQRADGLGVSAANAFDAGHERRRDGAEPGRENAELSAGGANGGGRSHELFSFQHYWRVPVRRRRRSQKVFSVVSGIGGRGAARGRLLDTRTPCAARR